MGLPVDELGLELQIGAADPVAAPSGVIDVVVRNLLQNALRDRDPGGIVHVSLGGGRLIVANPTTASGRGGLGAHSGERHGFGLSIVGDLCARFGWEFQVRPEAAHFEVVVDFGRGMPH
jgi:signal transduction histidine kinase